MMSRALAKGKPNNFAACLLTDLTENLDSFDLCHELELHAICKLSCEED
jgi:hypothetical protein